MSKPSRRPTREARKEHKQKRREAQRQLRAVQAQRGVVPPRASRTAYALTRLRPKNRRRSIRGSGPVGGISGAITEAAEGFE